MECVNCNKTFERFEKGYRRTSLLSKDRHEETLRDVIGSKITPKTGRADQRFLCTTCDKLFKVTVSGSQAKKELFGKTVEGSYVARKRKHSLEHTLLNIQSPQAKRSKSSPRMSTPLKTKQFPRLSRGAKALANFEYKAGFKWYLKNSKAAVKALHGVIKNSIRRDVRSLLRKKSFPLTQKASVAAFRGLDWNTILRSVRRKVPFLYNALVAVATKKNDDLSLLRGVSGISVKPVIGTVLAMLLKQVQPLKASMLQKMNAVHMWRSGAKRGLLKDFSHLGFTVGMKGLLATLDTLTKEFDTELRQWRFDVESHIYPDDTRPDTDVQTPGVTSSSSSTEGDSTTASSTASSLSDEDQWSDVESISSPESECEEQDCSTSDSTSDIPPGYTICWDNVGRQVKARHQTRNCGNKYYSWALAYAAKNRINTNKYTDANVVTACDVPLEAYYLTTANIDIIKERMKIQISRILVKYIDCFEHLRDVTPAHILHRYSVESRKKSEVLTTNCEGFPITESGRNSRLTKALRNSQNKQETVSKAGVVLFAIEASRVNHINRDIKPSNLPYTMFNIGVLDENPSSTSGVINILDSLHAYVPRKDAQHLHQILTWGDGLSCERHVDAQNARANSATSLERLEGLEPAPQEFHKRMLMMQDTMNQLFDGRSATDKGTLFYLKNIFNQRSVSKNVSESFSYVSEFLKFVTQGYVLLFALEYIGMDSLDDSYPEDILENDDEDNRQLLDTISTAILEKIWCQPTKFSTTAESTDGGYTYCICKEDLEEEGEPMIMCENPDCSRGLWFHFDCIGISEDNVPSGAWFCCTDCQHHLEHYTYCVCKTFIKDEPMVACDYDGCPRQWFHAKCIGLKQLPDEDESWYCSTECKRHHKRKRHTSSTNRVDMKYEYTKAVVWKGLSDMVKRDAVRENDGPLMLLYWKMDIAAFANDNHYKYFILAHRLLTSINGWKPRRIIEDLTWNRTVNLKGGAGHNNEMDLVNEFLNREFKESIASVGSRLTADTLERHGKLAGGVSEYLAKLYGAVTESHTLHMSTTEEKDRRDDMDMFIALLKPEKLVQQIPGRHHKAFPTVTCSVQIKNVQKYNERIRKLSKRLDNRKREVAN